MGVWLQFGNGLVYSVGSGNFKAVGSPEGTVQLVRIQVCLGTVVYVGGEGRDGTHPEVDGGGAGWARR